MFSCCAADGKGEVVEPVTDLMDERQGSQEETKQKAEAETPAPEPEPAEKKDEMPQAALPQPVVAEQPTTGYFEIDIPKGDAVLGLSLDSWTIGLYISGIQDGGVVKDYNASAEASKKVQVSDFIVGVNGTTQTDKMVVALKSERQLKLKLFRSAPIKINISKGDKLLGLNVSIQKEVRGKTIFVQGLLDGAAQDYNEGALPEAQVKTNDCIISVNGVTDDAGEMLAAMKRDKDVEFVLLRAPA